MKREAESTAPFAELMMINLETGDGYGNGSGWGHCSGDGYGDGWGNGDGCNGKQT